jgi:molybdopterin-guanine dinucleotide biosynthesis protein A
MNSQHDTFGKVILTVECPYVKCQVLAYIYTSTSYTSTSVCREGADAYIEPLKAAATCSLVDSLTACQPPAEPRTVGAWTQQLNSWSCVDGLRIVYLL